MLDVRQQNQEFIAAMTTDGVDFADDGRQAVRGALQHLIPDRVAEGVVDHLEVVHVDEQQPQITAIAPCHGDGVREPVEQKFAVRQVGQRIQLGGLGDLFQSLRTRVRFDLREQCGQHRILIGFQQLRCSAAVQMVLGRLDLPIQLIENGARRGHYGPGFIGLTFEFGQIARSLGILLFDGWAMIG